MDVDAIAAAGAFAAMARPATYLPVAGPSVTCKAFRSRTVVRIGALGEVAEMADIVEFRVADVPQPERGAMVRFSDGDWRIDGPPDRRDNGVVACVVVKCR